MFSSELRNERRSVHMLWPSSGPPPAAIVGYGEYRVVLDEIARASCSRCRQPGGSWGIAGK